MKPLLTLLAVVAMTGVAAQMTQPIAFFLLSLSLVGCHRKTPIATVVTDANKVNSVWVECQGPEDKVWVSYRISEQEKRTRVLTCKDINDNWNFAIKGAK